VILGLNQNSTVYLSVYPTRTPMLNLAPSPDKYIWFSLGEGQVTPFHWVVFACIVPIVEMS
jgi:hypothetical protein